MPLLHEVTERLSAQRASQPAIISVDDGSALSYNEMWCRSRTQAKRLRHLGLLPGDRVAIIAHKAPDVIAAFLAASRAGVTYVPLDIQASQSYWTTVLEDLEITDVLSNVLGLAEKLRGFRVHDLDPGPSADAAPATDQAQKHLSERTPDDDAYILTTSGSTGRPKGVLLSHRNALAFADWAVKEVSLRPHDKVLSVAPFHFDLSVFDIYGTLGQGATLVLAPATATMFPGQLIETVETYKISVLYTVPTVLRTLMEAGAFADDAGRSLRTIIYAGEPFPVPALAALMQTLPTVTFHNFFGPTETNVSLAHRITEPPDPVQEVPIGRPASGASITLVDENGVEVKSGDIGEIVVNGPTVMKGYLRANGFEPAKRTYATGDFAQEGPNGVYYFRGRRDQQVKVRGLRIELAAVEHALLATAGVKEAAALIIGNDLVAFIATDCPIEDHQLRTTCKDALPPGAVPHKFVSLPNLPRLSNHKLDLAHLKALASGSC
jgi:amino acid adenylation domain-containing protein